MEISKAEFPGDIIRSTNTFFVNGGEDPWRWAGLQKSKSELNLIARVADCDNCGHCLELYNEEVDDPV